MSNLNPSGKSRFSSRDNIVPLREDADFEAAYAAACREALQRATARLQRAASSAVDTLESIAGNTKAPTTSQVQAATKILEFAFRADRLAEVEALLDELLSEDE